VSFPANVKHILFIHDCLVVWFADSEDPFSPPGVKNIELLESAIARPFQSIAGADAYPSPFEKAGALFHSLINNHPFHNGNKRTALVSTAVYLASCGFWLEKCSDDEMFSFTLDVTTHSISEHRKSEVKVISSWLQRHSIKQSVCDSLIGQTNGDCVLKDEEHLLAEGRLGISYSVSEIIEFRRIFNSAQSLWKKRNNVIRRLAKT
jgi:death-on-curing family protein